MPQRALAFVCGFVPLVGMSAAVAIEPTPVETAAMRVWVDAHFGEGPGSQLPSSLQYGGKPALAQFKAATVLRSVRRLDALCEERTATVVDSTTGLVLRWVATVYRDVPAVEWVMHLTNRGHADTPILEDVEPIDSDFGPISDLRPFMLHHAEGSHERITDFQPRATRLGPGERLALGSYGGRSSDGSLPFFNLAFPGGGGVVVGVGWTGQWSALFDRRGKGAVRIRAGMQQVHTMLRPGESIRSPSVVLLFWDGPDRMRGQNLLRRLILGHATQKVGDKPVIPPCAASPHAVVPFEKTDESNMLQAIANIASHGVEFDTWWIDTGWFTCGSNWARYVGNPDPDPVRFPRGLKPVADAAHRAGLHFLLWFEPERVMPGTWLHEHHPEWLLKPGDTVPAPLRYEINDGFHLFDLGNPEALAWLKAKLSGMIGAVGIDVYRNDFNMYPVDYWRNAEPTDRQGMREIRYVEGLYDLFDTLKREHPNVILDTCASGGRRIDWEMLRRALVLTRSDYLWDPTGQQCHTYGLAQWVPITGIGAASLDPYNTRSGLGGQFTLAADYYAENPKIWSALARAVGEFHELTPFYTGDFYPLGEYSTSNTAWMAWQAHRGDLDAGLVQAFRRQDCSVETATHRLHGLDAGARYSVTDRDTAETRIMIGRDLMDHGLTFRMARKPSAAIVTYRRIGLDGR